MREARHLQIDTERNRYLAEFAHTLLMDGVIAIAKRVMLSDLPVKLGAARGMGARINYQRGRARVGDDIEVIGQAINMSRTPFEMKTATPEQGEHTDQVLREFGYDDAAIAGFRKKGVL